MSAVPLRVVERPDTSQHNGALRIAYPEDGYGVEPGDIWREPSLDDDDREAWAIVLPNLSVWYTTDRAGASGRWDVTGVPPALTVHPSINVQGDRSWHGWIRDGKLEAA